MIAVFILSYLFTYIYEDMDSLIVIDDSLLICGSHHYTIKIDISKSTLTVRQWDATDSTGWLFLDAPHIYMHDSSQIDGSDSGYRGGTVPHPDGFGPGYGESGGGNGGGGGGAGYGGNGGQGGDDYPGSGGSAYGGDSDTTVDMGSGGGAGRLSVVDGHGGNGGAEVYLRGQKIVIDSSYIHTNGQAGLDGSLEAGGGGSGGSIMVRADSVLIHGSRLYANGGRGGDASFGGGGGAGGGRIKLFYSLYLDTSAIDLSVVEGAAGTGSYGEPEPGTPGSTYTGLIVGITEAAIRKHGTIINANPVKDGFTITLEQVPALLKLYDISGRVVKVLWITNMTEYISLDDIRQGVYFVRLDKDNRQIGKVVLLR